MIKFSEALAEWQTPMFADILQREIKMLNVDQLLLQQALMNGSYATTDEINLIILSMKDDEKWIYARVGVFYNSMIPGCQCDDDPSPMNVESEYCELQFDIDKNTAETKVSLLS